MFVREPIVGSLLVVFVGIGYCAEGEPNQKEDRELVKRMILFLEREDVDLVLGSEAICNLPRLVPSSTDAQKATMRYLERVAATGSTMVPIWYARSLCMYDAAFASKLVALLVESQNDSVNRLCWTTLALMGKKAGGQVKSLEEYLRRQSDPLERVRVRIALAVMGATLDNYAQAIEQSIRQRERAALEAVEMGARIGFRGWATEKAVSEVRQWLGDDLSDEYKCPAAISLAASGYCDKQCESRLKTLLGNAMSDPEKSTTRICCAYALALVDADRADKYWRVIAKTCGEGMNHTDSYAMAEILVSIPVNHVQTLRRLCKDADSEVAAGAQEILKALERACITGGPRVP